MSTAPLPPTKRLMAIACLTGGATIGALAIIVIKHFVYGIIPSGHIPAYALAILAGACISGWSASRYLVQKHRRDAWWDGFAAGDEPLAEVIPLRTLKGFEGSTKTFVNISPG